MNLHGNSLLVIFDDLTASFSLRDAQQNSRSLCIRRLALMFPGWEYFCCLLKCC